MRLQELLQLPVYRNSRVLAGQSGLGRQVKSVNMMDAPDIIDYLKPDELLLTTAYAMRDNPDKLHTLIGQMASCQCAGLGIKTKRFLQEIPQAALALAEELHFPVIELSLEPSLGELMQESLSFIMEKNNEELRYALKMHRDFSQLIMQGKGSAAIVQALSALAGGTVLLVDRRLRIAASSGPAAADVTGRLLAQIPDVAAGQQSDAPRFIRFCLVSPKREERYEVMLHPIELPYQTSYLVLLDAQLNESPLPRLAVEQASNVIGFELMKQQALKERSRRYKNEFFEDLTEGRFSSAAEILNIGKRFGLEPSPCLCVAGKMDEGAGQRESGLLYARRDHVYEIMKTALAEYALPCVLFTNKELFGILLRWDRQGEVSEQRLTDCLLHIQEQLYRLEQISYSFGIGNPVEQLTNVPATYKEALNALQTGYQSRQTRFIQFYRTKEAVELLKMIPQGALRDFYTETFHNILELEEDEREELMTTARVFLETQGQIGETAKRLFIHRNTVTYRLNKYEQLTRRNLRDPNHFLQFRLAFLIDDLL